MGKVNANCPHCGWGSIAVERSEAGLCKCDRCGETFIDKTIPLKLALAAANARVAELEAKNIQLHSLVEKQHYAMQSKYYCDECSARNDSLRLRKENEDLQQRAEQAEAQCAEWKQKAIDANSEIAFIEQTYVFCDEKLLTEGALTLRRNAEMLAENRRLKETLKQLLDNMETVESKSLSVDTLAWLSLRIKEAKQALAVENTKLDESKDKCLNFKKPPLGIMPEKLFIERRLHDLLEAIGRYQEAGMTTPEEWSEEMFRITARMIELQKRKEKS